MDFDLASSTETLIDLALAEDLGANGDITSRSFVPETHRSRGVIVAREDAVLAGIEIAATVFEKVDPALEIAIEKSNGAELLPLEVVMTITGSTQSILTAERTALNFLQRLSGIATLTREFVARAAGASADVEILDTRKTTPGWRILEKAAVATGGGRNHRMGLYDAAMVKDNHLVAENSAAALEAGIESIRAKFPDAFIELEADQLDQVRRFLAMKGVDVILLDNMTCDQLREAVALRNDLASAIKLEASGGVNLDTVAEIAGTGVDCISVGALTHSAKAADLALDLESLESDA